ncbi:MAG: hypothetical protein HUU50_00915 [Candidatus Brocadiae bacterium]|nr:hypothetical protein [Candidatus Brocadiia bacterium]
MNSGTYMVPVTVNDEQKKYIAQQYPGKSLEEALLLFITECLKNKESYSFHNSGMIR